MVEQELKSIVRGREKRTLEYKEAWSELPSNLFESVCAFLNRDGGVIVLGAMDDGTIDKGVNPKSIDQMCKNLANMSNNGQEGTQRVSLRDKVFREVVTNMLIHREYLNPSISLIDIREDYVLIQNANRPLRSGVITLDNYEPHPKNPHLANFFVQMGHAEHLGTGVRNLYHYAPLYFGETPLINDDDMFRVCFKISEAKQTEITTNKTTNKTINKTTNKTTNKTADKILKLIAQNPEITSAELSKRCGVSPDGVRYHIRNMKRSKLIVRVGGKKKGYWDVSE